MTIKCTQKKLNGMSEFSGALIGDNLASFFLWTVSVYFYTVDSPFLFYITEIKNAFALFHKCHITFF